jgi:hypothetical protein
MLQHCKNEDKDGNEKDLFKIRIKEKARRTTTGGRKSKRDPTRAGQEKQQKPSSA